MVAGLFLAIMLGIMGGYYFIDLSQVELLDTILMHALYCMILIAGIEIGSNRQLLKKICTPQNLLLALALPVANILGSLVGAWGSGWALGLSFYDSTLLALSLGWYSLASVLVSTSYSTEVGTLVFLSNMLREVSSFVLIPLLAKWHKLLCIAPGGAATMDSLLPLVIRSGGMHTGMFSFVQGLVLSLLVPVFLSLLLG